MTIQNDICKLQALLDATHEIDCDSCRCSESSCAQCDEMINNLSNKIDELKEELSGSDEDREWHVRDDGGWHGIVIAESAETALDEVEYDMDIDNYADANGNTETVYVTLWAECELTGEKDRRDVVLEPDAPKCSHDRGHRWVDASDGYDFVESSDYACIHCGCSRTEKSRPGCDGILREYVSYEIGKYQFRMEECA